MLVNDEGQHSLWPANIDVPGGWAVARDRGSRDECLQYVNEHWTDMRPNSLVAAMEESWRRISEGDHRIGDGPSDTS